MEEPPPFGPAQHLPAGAPSFMIIPFLFFLGCATTSGTTTKSAGKYFDWNGFIDELEIVNPFNINNYSKVLILPIDSSTVPLPDKSDNSYAPLTKVISRLDQIFREGLSKGMKGLNNISLESSKSFTSEAGESSALVMN